MSDMIGLMMYGALLVGLLLGFWLFYRNSGLYMSALVYIFDSSKRRFMVIYDLMDDERFYDFMILDGIKTYADYLRLHEAARKTIYKRFQRQLRSVRRTVLNHTLLGIALPSLVFWSNWYWYLLGFTIAALIFIAYARVALNRGRGYYLGACVNALFVEYLRDK